VPIRVLRGKPPEKQTPSPLGRGLACCMFPGTLRPRHIPEGRQDCSWKNIGIPGTDTADHIWQNRGDDWGNWQKSSAAGRRLFWSVQRWGLIKGRRPEAEQRNWSLYSVMLFRSEIWGENWKKSVSCTIFCV